MKMGNNENTPLTIDEIIALAKEDYPQYTEQFKVSEKKDTVVFEVDGYRHVEAVDKLCRAEVNGNLVPKRDAMMLNIYMIFDEMEDILKEKSLSRNYYIGKSLCFVDENNEIDVGTITEIIETETGTKYKIRTLAEESAEEVWKYLIITKDDIVQIKSNMQKPAHDKWTVAHMAEINKAFGKDVSDYLILIYDSLEDAEKEFDEYARNEKFGRQVLDKWVFLAG